MSLFIWYKTYSVNNVELDNHHKALLDILNRLYDNCLIKDIENCLYPIIEELVSYSNYHLPAEEQHMRSLGYWDIDKHILEHRVFEQRILQLQRAANKDGLEDTTKELIIYLGSWLLHHIMEEDKKYSL